MRLKIGLFIPLFILCYSQVSGGEPSCDEVLAYFSSAVGRDGQSYFLMTCGDDSVPIPLKSSLAEQGVRLEAWSTPARAVAYHSTINEISIVTEADLTPRVLIPDTGQELSAPTFSPDGKYIAYTAVSLDANYRVVVASIEVSDLEGNVQTLYTTTENGVNRPGRFARPTWSSDGKLIAYRYDRKYETSLALLSTDCLGDSSKPCTSQALNIMDKSGERPTFERQLAENQSVKVPEYWDSPIWLQDQNRLAFSCMSELCFLNSNGTNFERMKGLYVSPDIVASPSGHFLAYSFDFGIYLFNLEKKLSFELIQSQVEVLAKPIWISLPEGEFLLDQGT